jgi:hypothetical protein
MTRGKQKKPTHVHVNVFISRQAYEYFSQQPNLSAAVREVLDNYIDTHNNVRSPTTEEQADESAQES